MSYFLLLYTIFFSLEAKEISPVFKLKSIGFVNDFVIDGNYLYAGNDMGTVDIFDIKKKKIINQIVLPMIVSGRDMLVAANVMSVDYINGKVLIVSIGEGSYRNVWIYENYELKNIIDETKKLTIKEARFLDDEQIIFGTLGSDVVLHDTKEHYNIYQTHISQSTIGDIVLSSDKTELVFVDESGEVKILDAKSSKVKKSYSSQNVDNIYHVAYSKGVILTAGQDRRMAVYQDGKKDYHLKSSFLVYCVGLSPSAKIGVYTSNEQNHLQLFDPRTKSLGDILVGHNTSVNQINFISEYELFSSDGRDEIFYWNID